MGDDEGLVGFEDIQIVLVSLCLYLTKLSLFAAR